MAIDAKANFSDSPTKIPNFAKISSRKKPIVALVRPLLLHTKRY